MSEQLRIYKHLPEPAGGTDRFARLRAADDARDAAVMTMTLLKIMQDDTTHTFASLEQDLRDLGCRSHLIAIPAGGRPSGYTVRDLWDRTQSFSLFVAGSVGQAQRKLAAIGTQGPDENVRNLRNTGLLVPSKECSRSMREAREKLAR